MKGASSVGGGSLKRGAEELHEQSAALTRSQVIATRGMLRTVNCATFTDVQSDAEPSVEGL